MFRPMLPSLLTRSLKLALNFMSGTLDSRITFGRTDATSCATYFNQYGLLVTQGLNLVYPSTNPGGTGWGIFGTLTATQNYITAPISSPFLATRLTWTTITASYTSTAAVNATATAGAIYTGSFYIKDNTGTSGSFNIQVGDSTSSNGWGASITPSTGTIAGYSFGDGTRISSSSVSANNGWYRITITGSVAASTNLFLFLAANAANGDISIFGSQLELGSVANQYSPTTTVATSGPRFDYDPTTPLDSGMRGPELATVLGTPSAGVTVDNTALTVTFSGTEAAYAGVSVNSAVNLSVGFSYILKFTYTGTASINITLGGSQTGAIIAGTYSFVMLATTTTPVYIQSSGTIANGVVSNISIKQIIPATTGVELVPNGNFASGGTDWILTATLPDTLTFSAGTCRIYSPDGNYTSIQNSITSMVSGNTYVLNFQITAANAGTIGFSWNGSSVAFSASAVGSYSYIFQPTSSTNVVLFKRVSGTTDITIANVSVQQVLFNPKGLLIEQAATNLIPYNNAMSGANWSQSGLTATSSTVAYIDGTFTTTLVTITSSSQGLYPAVGITVVASTTYAFSVDVHFDTLAAANYKIAFYDATNSAFIASDVVPTLTALSNGWYRASATVTTPSNCTSLRPYAYRNSASVTGTISVNLAQLEVGAISTSRIKTTTSSTVTRAVDNAYMSTTGWYNNSTGTILAQWHDQNVGVGGHAGLFSLNDGTNNIISYQVDTNSIPGFVTAVNSASAGATHIMGFSQSNTGQSLTLDGVGIYNGYSTNNIPTGVTTLNLGALNNNDPFNRLNGHLQLFNFYNTRLQDATLQTIAGGGLYIPTMHMDFLSGSLDNRISFGRADTASCATYFNQYGLLVTQGYNLLLNSVLAGGTGGVVGSGAVAPTSWVFISSGGNTTFPAANQVRTATTVTSQRPGLGQSITVATNSIYTLSTQIVAINGSTPAIQGLIAFGGQPTGASINYYVNGSLVTGTSTSYGVGNTISVVLTTTTTGGSVQCRVGVNSTSGSDVADLTFQNVQFEIGSIVNLYSPTTTTATSGPRFDYDPTTPLDSGARGPQLVTNGNFSSSAGWVTSGTASINTSLNEGVFVASSDKLSQTATTFTSGLTYSVSITLLGSGSLTLYAGLGTQLIANPTTASAFTYIFTATTTASLYIISNGYVGAIQNVSVQQVIPATNGTEMITNSNFASGSTGWTQGATLPDTITFAAGSVTLNNTTDGAYIGITQPTSGLQLGATYRFQVVVSSITTSGNGLTLDFTGAQTTSIINSMPASGTYTGTVTITGVNPGIELKRLGTGTTVNATVTQISCQQVVFNPKGLLIEQGQSNLYSNSHILNAASWTGNATRTQNALGPDGTLSAWTVNTDTAGTGPNFNNYTTLSASTTYTRSIIAKAGTTPNLFFEYYDVDASNGYSETQFNLSTGALSGTTTGAYMRSIGNGWWICARTFTTMAGVPRADVNYLDTYGTTSNNTNIFVYNTQIENNSFATTQILTGTGGAGRGLDSAVITGSNLTSWFNPTHGTFITNIDTVSPTGTFPAAWCAANTSTPSNDRMLAFVSVGATLSSADIHYDVGGTNYINGGAPSIAINGSVIQHGFAYSTGNNGTSVAGNGTVDYFTVGGVPPVTQFNIGTSGTGGTPLNGHIRSLNYYNVRLPDTNLQALT